MDGSFLTLDDLEDMEESEEPLDLNITYRVKMSDSGKRPPGILRADSRYALGASESKAEKEKDEVGYISGIFFGILSFLFRPIVRSAK